MAHIYRHKDSGASFIYNADLSGDITIRLPKPDSDGNESIRIPAAALITFTSQWVGLQKIAAIQKAIECDDPKKLLGL